MVEPVAPNRRRTPLGRRGHDGGSVRLTTIALAVVSGLLFGLSSVVQYRCGTRGCDGGLEGLLDVEAVGGLPRLFTTAVFVAVAVVGLRSARQLAGGPRTWWTGIGVAGVLLGVAKLVSAHSSFESHDGRGVTLLVSLALSGLGIGLLAVGARRWNVPGARAVIAALVLYTLISLGLDAVAALARAAQDYSGLRSSTVLAFMEEFGEALGALALLAAVRWARIRELARDQS